MTWLWVIRVALFSVLLYPAFSLPPRPLQHDPPPSPVPRERWAVGTDDERGNLLYATAFFALTLSLFCTCVCLCYPAADPSASVEGALKPSQQPVSSTNAVRLAQTVSSALTLAVSKPPATPRLPSTPAATGQPTLRRVLSQVFITAGLPGKKSAASFLKWSGLALLVLQSSTLYLLLSSLQPGSVEGPSHSGAEAVMITEIVKLIICLLVVSCGANPRLTFYNALVVKWRETLLLAIPSLCYAFQNNLIQFAASTNISAVVLLSLLQMKTLTAAIFSVLLLGRRFSFLDWLSFIGLVLGVVLVQAHSPALRKQPVSDSHVALDDQLMGEGAACLAAILSGFAGVCLEAIYTKRASSIFVRNVQLCMWSMALQYGALLRQESASPDRPLLTGFDAGTWTVIFLQALGGLITAMVIKHAGNMPKAFASAFSLALATSVLMVAVDLDQSSPPLFGLGVVIIVGATLTFETRQVATCATWYMFTHLQRSPSVHGTFPCTRTAHAMM